MSPRIFPVIALALASLVVGCDRAETRRIGKATPTEEATYEVTGVLREIGKDGRTALIAHEAIPGYMEAMTMEFDVRESRELAGLAPGDVLAFRLSVAKTHGWIDRVRKIGSANVAPVSPRAALSMDSLQPGAALPDCTLVDERGRSFRLSDFRGSALAFTFIFTRCPFPNFCPLMNSQLEAAQRALAVTHADAGWRLLSISIDPAYDTPERLAKYAVRYQPNPARWSFATGEVSAIRRLGAAFGLAISERGGPPDHNLRTVVVDAEGKVRRVFAGNEWKPQELIDELCRAMPAQP